MKSKVAEGHRDFENGVKPCCTIREKLNDFIDDRLLGLAKKSCNEKTAELYRRRLMMFDQAFHSAPIDTISAQDVIDWMKRRLARPRRGDHISRDTVNDDVAALKTFARWAQGQGEAPAALPLLTAPRLQSPGKMAGKNWRPPEVMEIHRLLDIIDTIKAARPDIGLFFTGMLLFNLRPSEAAALKRSDVILPQPGRAGVLKCHRLKTFQKQDIDFEYDSVFHKWALECLALGCDGYRRPASSMPLIICITGRCKRNPGGWMTDNLDKATERVCAQLGITLSRPYIIRHSIVTWLGKQADVPAAAVSAHASHLKQTTTDIYRHLTAADAKPAMAAIQNLMESRIRKTG